MVYHSLLKLSKEELEKIKQANKAKDLQEIIAEEKATKDDGFNVHNDEDDDYDPNFIASNGLKPVIRKKRKAVRPIAGKIRSLANEVGGLEENVKEAEEILEEEEEIEDEKDDVEKIIEDKTDVDVVNQDQNESFIHLIKTGYGHRKKLGKMNLKEAAELSKGDKPIGHVERLINLRQDRTSTKKGNSLTRH